MNPTPEKPGEKHLQEVMQDIACPKCGYNLRGLSRPVATCPECGLKNYIDEIIRLNWQKHSWQAPGYLIVFSATLFAVFYPFLAGGLIVITNEFESDYRQAVIFSIGVGILIWLTMIYMAFRVFDSFKGVALSLLAHVIVGTYINLLCIPFLLSAAIQSLFNVSHLLQSLLFAVIAVIMVAAAWFARRGEKWIAKQCINRHLQRMS